MTRDEQIKRATDAVQRGTGKTWCANGAHFVPDVKIVRRKPTVCERCVSQMAERRRAAK